MVKLSVLLLGLFVLKFIVSEANAGTVHERKRHQRQHERIDEGVESGTLTKNQAKALKKEQREIRKEELAAIKDGKMSNAEKKKIEQMQNKASKDIIKMKHKKKLNN